MDESNRILPYPLPLSTAPALIAPAPTPTISKPEQLMYKNKLQEYFQQSSLGLPQYETKPEGPPHNPQFRAAVSVAGQKIVSPNVFSSKKAAEQDVAKIALAHLIHKESCSVIVEDLFLCKSILHEFSAKTNAEKPTYTTVPDLFLCKSILHEFSAKTNAEKPTYTTVPVNAIIPAFVSTLVFNGQCYTGDVGKSKKEAEQLAARMAIRSIMGDSTPSKLLIHEIVKSKSKIYAAFSNTKIAGENCNNVPVIDAPKSMTEITPRTVSPQHVFKKPKQEESTEPINLPIAFVIPCLGQFAVGTNSSKKQKKKNKKNKAKEVGTSSNVDA